MSDLNNQINKDLKNAMLEKNEKGRDTLRLALAEIKKKQIDKQQSELEDADIIRILQKMIKQRHDSIDLFNQGKRQDLAEKEQQEILILEKYIPTALTDKEISAAIHDAITKTGAKDIKDMGKIMSLLKEVTQGRADMGKISQEIKKRLSSS
jgi:uncharacterized protein